MTQLNPFQMLRLEHLAPSPTNPRKHFEPDALALADLGPNDHLHVSFDVDFLDPDIAPGTGTPEHGGPNYREASCAWK